MKYKNNPFNIRKGSSHWLGSISQTGDQFESFDTLEHGIRAFFIIMRTYSTKYGRNTIRSIITRYAPPSENNVQSYIDYVSTKAGMTPDYQLHSWFDYIPLAKYMALFESNTNIEWYKLSYVWRYYHIANNSFPRKFISRRLKYKISNKSVHECETYNDLPF